MESSPQETRIILALSAIQRDQKLSVRKAASIYQLPEATLRHRRAGRQSRSETRTNSMKMTISEEEVILERVIDLIN